MTEPTFIRIRSSVNDRDVLPRCGRCNRTLRGAQRRWCSARCRSYMSTIRLRLSEEWDQYWRDWRAARA